MQCQATFAIYGMTKCSGCDSETSKFLMSTAGKSSSVSWSCTSCDSSIKKLHNMIGAVNSRVEQVENKIDDIKVVLDSLDEKIQNKVENVSQEMATAVTDLKNDVRIAVGSLNKKIDMLSSISDGETGPKTKGPLGVRHEQIMTPNLLSVVATELKERGNRAQNAVFTGDTITEEKVNLTEEKEADISGVALIDESWEAEFLQEFEEEWVSLFYIFGTHCLTFLNFKQHLSKTFIFILGW